MPKLAIEDINKYEYYLAEHQRNLSVLKMSPRSVLHLEKGYSIRRHCITHATHELLAKIGTKTAQTHDLLNCTILLNALYVNLRGAIDNLSWAFSYESQLISDAQPEDNIKLEVSLFNTALILKLKAIAPKIAAKIISSRKWLNDLKATRDPIAHRIPIIMARQIDESALKKLNEDFAANLEKFQNAGNNQAQTEYIHHPSFVYSVELSNSSFISPLAESIKDGKQFTWDIQKNIRKDIRRFYWLSHLLLTAIILANKCKKK